MATNSDTTDKQLWTDPPFKSGDTVEWRVDPDDKAKQPIMIVLDDLDLFDGLITAHPVGRPHEMLIVVPRELTAIAVLS